MPVDLTHPRSLVRLTQNGQKPLTELYIITGKSIDREFLANRLPQGDVINVFVDGGYFLDLGVLREKFSDTQA